MSSPDQVEVLGVIWGQLSLVWSLMVSRHHQVMKGAAIGTFSEALLHRDWSLGLHPRLAVLINGHGFRAAAVPLPLHPSTPPPLEAPRPPGPSLASLPLP